MKTLEEKAREYAGITPEICDVMGLKDFPGEQNTLNKYYNFIAGYKSALEWINVEDELPDSNWKGYILCKNSYSNIPYIERWNGDGNDAEYIFNEYNYWRHINLEDTE